MIDVSLRKRPFFAEMLSAFLELNLARDQQFKVENENFTLGAHKLGMDFSHAL